MKKSIMISVLQDRNFQEKKNQGIYFEEHHIKPKSLYPELKKEKNKSCSSYTKRALSCTSSVDKIHGG